MSKPKGVKIVTLVLCGMFVLLSGFFVQGILLPVRVIGSSMAETFRGPHYIVSCENCQFRFAVDATTLPSSQFSCLNCGSQTEHNQSQSVIAGDRVLVDRISYQFRDPQRWETVLFRSVDPPMEHCLKRVVGLPNENVAIIEGDLWVDGKRLKKNWSMLESLALTVHDSRYVPQKSMAVSRWRPQREQTRWKKKTQGVQGDQYFQNSEKIDQDPLIDWLVYEHVDFHRGHRRTTGRITDNYAYNQALSRRLYRTDDLIFSAQIQCSGNGQLFFQVGDCCLQLDCSQERGTLCESGQRVADFLWDPTDLHASVRVDIAAVDKQFFFVIDGEVIFRCNLESDLVSDSTQNATDSICIAEKNDMFPLALGSQSLRVTLKEILVRRDIYYTPDVRGVLGIRTNNYNLGEDEFFVLGDNSPVSLDSRRDLDAAILHRSDLLGRVWRWR